MIPFIAQLLAICLLLFSGSIVARTITYGEKLCVNNPQFACYKAQKGDTWEKLFSDSNQRDLVMRVNRQNTLLGRGEIIAVPNNLYASPLDYSPVSKQITPPTPGDKTIIISIKKLSFGAYDENGNLQYWGPVSTGRGYCPDMKGHSCHTARGQFTIYRKEGAHCVSTKFPVGRGGAPMPYCMFFKGGFAMHGSYEVPGYNDSHGCVRMFVNDAKWLNEDFTKNPKSVRIVINQD